MGMMATPTNEEGGGGKTHWEQLLPVEHFYNNFGIHPVSSLTWFEAPLDVEMLREQATKVILKNPWLVGKVEVREEKVGLAYSTIKSIEAARIAVAENHVFNVFQAGEIEIYPDLKHEDQCEICKSHPTMMLKPREELTSKTLWKISVFLTADGKYFGMTVTISHVVADGYTSYRCLEALMGTEDSIPSLIVKRKMETVERQAELMGEQSLTVFEGSDGLILGLRGVLCQTIFEKCFPRQWSPQIRTYEVDPAKIEKIKQNVDKSVTPFISTNDIITSWFLKGSNGMYFMNMRSKIADHSPDLAGNYQNLITLRPADTATPELIRLSTKKLRRFTTSDKEYSFWERMSIVGASKCKIVTNMASFYPKNVNPAHKVHLHRPIFEVPLVSPICVVHNTGKGNRLGVFVYASPSVHESLDPSLLFVTKDE